ncbi:hypothetical protein [Nocardioides sp.]|uniref:hypothetical protein n=1 Tax=Nocardioides sp. TaxID=35761 RepID=UPI00286CEF6D|nr:hypothetical protein [Nocardioides sp.]
MNDWVMGAVLVLSAVALLGIAVLLVKDQTAGDPLFALLAVIEVVLLVQLVVGSVQLSGTERDVSGVLFVSYLVGILTALPIGAFWSLAERTRAGTAVLAVAAFTVIALELRLDAIWGGAGA